MTGSYMSTLDSTGLTDISKQPAPGVGQKTETLIEDVTEDMLKEEIFIYITETDLITVLDLPSISVSVKSDDAPGVQ